MKCDNCGNEYSGSLKCPLCGNHQGKISHCSVCSTTIHYGQSNCSKCGSPTKYAKHGDVSDQYSSKFMPTDYSKHSDQSHVYRQPEMYDYKSSDASIKQRLLEAQQKITNISSVPKRNNFDQQMLKNIVILIAVVVVSAGIMLSSIIGDSEYNSKVNTSMVENVEIIGSNSNLAKAGNYLHEGHVYFNDGNLYIGAYDNISFTNQNLDAFEAVSEDCGTRGVYVEDNYLYFDDYGSYVRYNLDTGDKEELFSGVKFIAIGDHRFIYDTGERNGIFLYANGQSSNITLDRAYDYCYDWTSGLVYYQYNQMVYANDLNGQNIATYDIKCSGDMYVDQGILYYADYEGIKSYDTTNGNSDLLVGDGSIYEFIIMDSRIAYTDFDDNLYYYQNDEAVFIDSGVKSFNVAGDLIIYNGTGEEEYADYWYGADEHGNIYELPLINEEV